MMEPSPTLKSSEREKIFYSMLNLDGGLKEFSSLFHLNQESLKSFINLSATSVQVFHRKLLTKLKTDADRVKFLE
jgi:hypothetical protein